MSRNFTQCNATDVVLAHAGAHEILDVENRACARQAHNLRRFKFVFPEEEFLQFITLADEERSFSGLGGN